MSRLPIFVEALINEHRISGHPGDLKVIQDLPFNEIRLSWLKIYRALEGMTEVDEREIPDTWWDHFKDEKFPLWLKRFFPVKYRTIRLKVKKNLAVCPHVS